MQITGTKLKLHRKPLWKRCLECWQIYLLLLVPLAYIIIFKYVPMIGIQIAFKKYTHRLGIWGSPWIGWKNFNTFFNSYQFTYVIKNTLLLSLYSIVAGFPLPIIFALMINAFPNRHFKKTVQMVSYAPHFISIVVMVGMILTIMQSRTGLYGVLCHRITGVYPPDIFSIVSVFPHLYVWSGIWQNLGWNAIIYISALSSVNPCLHEAAMIDGANRFQRILHIDFFALLPTASILLILDAGRVLNVGFEKVYLMQNTANLQCSEVISTYVYKVGLTAGTNFSLSTAIGLFNSVVNMTILVIVNYASRKIGDTSLF